MDTLPFSELGLSGPLLEAVEKMGFEQPSPIQAKTIPLALAGKDIIGLSQTGSGKTAAFALPTLQQIDATLMKPQALIVCPTRELAVQVCEEVFKLGSALGNIRSMPVYGGAPIDRQLRALRKGTHIVVGTPGRLLDHLRRKSFDPSHIKTVILDEADRMLDMGFREEMEDMLKVLPKNRQTLFFSATMNPGVRRLIEKFGNEPELIEIERKALTVSSIDQSCYEVRGRSKVEALSRIIDIEQPKLSLIFCNTKRVVDDLTESLLARGFTADRLHGDITQSMRERVLAKFREGTVEILVATDVAARGLDIDDVELVVNFELPQDPEDYVHRIGRTGRAGRDGKAVNFVFGRDIYRLQTIEKYIRQPIRRERIPTREQVEGRRADQLFETIQERLEAGDYKSYQPYLDRLLEQGHTATDISNALITLTPKTTSTALAAPVVQDATAKPSTLSSAATSIASRRSRNIFVSPFAASASPPASKSRDAVPTNSSRRSRSDWKPATTKATSPILTAFSSKVTPRPISPMHLSPSSAKLAAVKASSSRRIMTRTNPSQTSVPGVTVVRGMIVTTVAIGVIGVTATSRVNVTALSEVIKRKGRAALRCPLSSSPSARRRASCLVISPA